MDCAFYLFQQTQPAPQPATYQSNLADLSPTERRILRLIADYKTSKEIADDLGIHYRTVENYRTSMCAKLDLHGSHALIKFALKHQAEL
ncbi:MAG: helix-turn-helix transcriptional regulator [Acidobacteria bacterium]|nr:helix-turn-helix transcriptional regulator [Acidobacteriota bacterium]MBI3428407.1 helix-turn-helix transcriptional regulator [Acidobacteriota bacterium]